MQADLRIEIGNAVERFEGLGRRYLEEGDFASAGAAFAIQHWIFAFALEDRGATAALPFVEEKKAKAPTGKKRGRKPKVAAQVSMPGASRGDTDRPPAETANGVSDG